MSIGKPEAVGATAQTGPSGRTQCRCVVRADLALLPLSSGPGYRATFCITGSDSYRPSARYLEAECESPSPSGVAPRGIAAGCRQPQSDDPLHHLGEASSVDARHRTVRQGGARAVVRARVMSSPRIVVGADGASFGPRHCCCRPTSTVPRVPSVPARRSGTGNGTNHLRRCGHHRCPSSKVQYPGGASNPPSTASMAAATSRAVRSSR